MEPDRYKRLMELEGRRSALKLSGRDRMALVKLERLAGELLEEPMLDEVQRDWLRRNRIMYLGSLLELEDDEHEQVEWADKLALLLDVVHRQTSACFDSGDAVVRLRSMRRYTGLAKYALLASAAALNASFRLQRHVRLHEDVSRRFASVLRDENPR